MTGKEYILVAEIIRTLPKAFGLRNTVAKHFSEKLKEQRNFKSNLFLEAAGFSAEGDEE